MSPMRQAFNWYGAVLFWGCLVATAVTIPFLIIYGLIYGLDNPPSDLTLRSAQVIQGIIIAFVGGYIAMKLERKKRSWTYSEIKRSLFIMLYVYFTMLIGMLVFISIPRYGVTRTLILNASVVFGSFSVFYLWSVFHFAKRAGSNNSNATDT